MKKTYNKYIKFFIPRIAFDHLHYKIKVNQPQFEYDIDIFYSLLNDLSNIKYFNDYTANNELIPLYSKLLQKKYGNNYPKYIQYLHVNSIIYGSTYYSEGNCSYYALVTNNIIGDMLLRDYCNTTYCLNIYNSNTIQLLDINKVIRVRKKVKNIDVVQIKIPIKSKVGKYITTQYNKEQDRIKHYSPHIRIMAKHFKDTIAIAYDDAIGHAVKLYKSDIDEAGNDEALIQTAHNKYDYRVRSIIEISEGKKGLRFNRNRSNGRIDTNLTNLSKDLRPFLVGYDGLSYLDLANSQPVLFNIMLNQYNTTKNPKLRLEIDLYRATTIAGAWYELLSDIFKVDRDKAKEIWMQIAYSQNKSYKRLKQKFAKKFSEITKIIESKKITDHAAFSIALQKIESKIFIDEICKELVENGIIPYTLHDGILVPKNQESKTYDIMAKILMQHLGSVPIISINR